MIDVLVSVLSVATPRIVAAIVIEVAYIDCAEIVTGMQLADDDPSAGGQLVDSWLICTGMPPWRYMRASFSGVDGSQSVSNCALVMMPLWSVIFSAARLSSRSASCPATVS